MYDFGLGYHWLNPQGTFKVFCKANKGLCLAVRDGALVLAATDPTDEHQHWFKDIRFSLRIKDTEGKPVFSLVNKATGLAVQHSLGSYNRVRLVKFNPEDFDESVLWTESSHLGRDFSHIRMMHNINLGLHALPGDEEGGGRVQDGTTIVVMEWDESDNQSWKILSWKDEDNTILGGLEAEPTCRIYCKAYKGFSVTVRNGIVCLAPTNFNDKFQQWIEDKRPGNMMKDVEGYPAFTVINRATGDAIEASLGKGNPLKLKAYNPCFLDEFVLWAKGRNMGDGFRCLHMLCNNSLNFKAIQADKDHGGVHNDTYITLSGWSTGDNIQLLWKIVPW
ncbi:ricin B-like lectin R40C1 [Panicum virgatum]|uniref:PH domain-containing protein n=1 Tax=Panicum virgatum TaxID=38727 RepID=A0A8T0MPS5_PANVG|nr:ricin B-like lectin R40C1 [Panicum virgatum]XP_039831633.1 ricin B-like lectin R40C1 [Panicum virgatum]KAG2536766.1 hypothetical protein PVAP13_9NG219000 [Panicum virgatum]